MVGGGHRTQGDQRPPGVTGHGQVTGHGRGHRLWGRGITDHCHFYNSEF